MIFCEKNHRFSRGSMSSPIHHYFYQSDEYPICEKERIQKMAMRWSNKHMDNQEKHSEKDEDKIEIMNEMLEKLKEKYNKH